MLDTKYSSAVLKKAKVGYWVVPNFYDLLNRLSQWASAKLHHHNIFQFK